MSATVFGTSRHGVVDDSTATGIIASNCSFELVTEQSEVRNHLGNEVGMAVYNDGIDVSFDGVIETIAEGLTPALADAVTLANTDADSHDISGYLFTSGTGGFVVTGMNVGRTNTAFETGSITAKWRPLITASSSSVVAD